MALGLIQFLLGGKNKKATSKNKEGNNSNPNPKGNVENNSNQETSTVNNAQNNITSQSNGNDTNSSNQSTEQNQASMQQNQSKGNKKSVSEVLMKMHKEMKESNERLTTVVTDVKKIENSVNSLTNRVDAIEKKDVEKEKKLKEIDSNMGQFLSLYELINNQYNPFVSKEDMPKMESPPQKEEELEENTVSPIEIETPELEEQKEENLQDNSNGTALEFTPEDSFSQSSPDREKSKEEVKTINLPQEEKPKQPPINQKVEKQSPKMSQSLLELDTLNIEEAAADAVPLTKLKNNTNALVIILSWLEFLIKRVGIEETRNTLRYYTETLRWMTPEVFFDLDKYLKGMSDNNHPQNSKTNVKDHIVSLYFISKLNEKSLDHRLTKAVLEIIDQ